MLSDEFNQLFRNSLVDGFVLVMPEYDEAKVAPWAICLRKKDNHHLALIVFSKIEDAQSELELFPVRMNLRLAKVSYLRLNAYLNDMNSITGGAVVAFTRNDSGLFNAI